MNLKRKHPILLLFCLVISLVSFVKAQTISPEIMLSAQKQDGPQQSFTALLYFRYGNTKYLSREVREVYYFPTTPTELAIIKALVNGPSSLYPHLSSLFPSGTEALNIASREETIFITFNEKILNRFADEALVFNTDYSQGEGRLRRQLAMASLVNTLTENTDYTRVQVLIRQENYLSSSMRLSNRYYLLNDDGLPAPLTRQEEYIMTPQVSAKIFFEGWQRGEFAQSLRMVRRGADNNTNTIPTDFELQQLFEEAPRLADFTVSNGIISMDGQSAMVTFSLVILQDNGQESMIQNRPMRLLMREGIFMISYNDFSQLLKAIK